MLEQLRNIMIEAFRAYQRTKQDRRDSEWDYYCKCREEFLEADAQAKGVPYAPLKYTLFPAGH